MNHRSEIDPSIWQDDPKAQVAISIVRRLQEEGFVSYLAGGCVRDSLLGKKPKDFDVATDAIPDRVREIFGRRGTLAYGAAFGVIGVLPSKSMRQRIGKSSTETMEKLAATEVATFRSDGEYSDGRRPDRVHFGNAEADAQRRDFTINGMFWDPVTNSVIDYVGGQEDLWNRRLRTIGNPVHRFHEDKLRMLRAVRFATTLDFEVDEATKHAIGEHAAEISVVSGERVGTEMRKVLSAENAAKGLRMVEESGLADFIFPHLKDVNGDRLTQRLRSIPAWHEFGSSPLSRFAVAITCAVQLTIKPRETVAWLRQQWKLSTEEVRAIDAAIRLVPVILHADQLAWSELQPSLIDRDIGTAMAVAKAQIHEGPQHHLGSLRRCADALELPSEELDPTPLLTGNDLRDLGHTPSPRFGEILQRLRALQLDQTIVDRQSAIEWIGDQFAG